MGKNPVGKKKTKTADLRGYATTCITTKKTNDEQEEDAEGTPKPGHVEGLQAENPSAAHGSNELAREPVESADGQATVQSAPAADEEEELEDWERLHEEDIDRHLRLHGIGSVPDAVATEDVADAVLEEQLIDEEELENAIRRRFDEEMIRLDRKANPSENPANQFERRGGTSPAGVVVVNKNAEQKIEIALSPMRDEDNSLRMVFPKPWRFKGKLTYERVSNIYVALEALSFKGDQIRWAMERTLGYNHQAALEMLFVNIPKEELPRQFGGQSLGDVEVAQAAAELPDAPPDSGDAVPDDKKQKAERGAVSGGSDSGAEGNGAVPGDEADEDDVVIEEEGDPVDENAAKKPTLTPQGPSASVDDADFNKRLIAQYCEGSDSDGSELLDPEERLDRERRADPTARYIKVAQEVENLMKLCKSLKEKKRTGAFKQNISADQVKQKEASIKIRRLQGELEKFEGGMYGSVDKARIDQHRTEMLKVKGSGKGSKGQNGKAKGAGSEATTPGKTKGADEPKQSAQNEKADGTEPDDDEAMPALFDETATTEEVPISQPNKPVRQYNIAQWRGPTPRQNLTDLLRKRLWGKQNAPAVVAEYKQMKGESTPGRERVKVVCHLPRGGGSKTFDPEEPCETVRDACNLAAAYALWKLIEDNERDGTKRNLPPTFRQRWQEWTEEQSSRLREAHKDFMRKKLEFLERLWRKRPPPMQPSPADLAGNVAKANADWSDEAGFLQTLRGERAAALRNEYRRRRGTMEKNEDFVAIQQVRDSLPVAGWREPVLRALSASGPLIISGATGSGKTTQVPQFVLEHALGQADDESLPNIIVTEPRRISAVSVAKRVSQELGDPPGGPGSRNSLVGYQIRMEKKVSQSTRLLFCTVGVLLKQLQNGVAALSRVTHIFIDEVHERSADCDLLILLLRQILKHNRPDLRVVLMSATMEVDKLARYFGTSVPTLAIPGRTFQVNSYWLEDIVQMSGYRCEEDSDFAKRSWARGGWNQKQTFQVSSKHGKKENVTAYLDDEEDWGVDDEAEKCDLSRYDAKTQEALYMMDHTKINFDVLEETLQLIEDTPKFLNVPRDEGAVLVFLPGLMEITKMSERLHRHPIFGDPNSSLVLSLHSVLSGEDHAKAFERPRRGIRKIILSTNIAETGVTIPDCVFVIDACKVKLQKYHEPTNTSSLKEQFVSRAEVMQRRGRAGRVRDGFAFHLMTEARFSKRLQDVPTPEILRCSLMELMLSVLSSGLQPACFLEALDPPPKARIDQSVATLKAAGAVEHGLRPANAPQFGVEGDVWYLPTPIGLGLARLPCDLRLGKMALLGAIFGGNEAAWTVAATLSHRSPLVTPFSEQKRALAKSVHAAELVPQYGPPSDLSGLATAYQRWDDARRGRHADSHCKKSWINGQVMSTIRELRKELIESLQSDGFVEKFSADEVSKKDIESTQVTNALFFGGLYPNVARVDAPKNPNDKHFIIAAGSEQLKLHPGSLCYGKSESLHRSNHRWVCYHTKMKTSQIFLRDCTFLTPNALLLFGGDVNAFGVHPAEKCITSGNASEKHWHVFYIDPRMAAMIRQLRYSFDALLRRKAMNSHVPLSESDRAIILAYVAILNSVDLEA